jgi:hypothetical protein
MVESGISADGLGRRFQEEFRFPTRYQRVKLRRGSKRAATAVSHAQIIALYWVLRTGKAFEEHVRDSEETRRVSEIQHHLRRLTQLGYEMSL